MCVLLSEGEAKEDFRLIDTEDSESETNDWSRLPVMRMSGTDISQRVDGDSSDLYLSHCP